METKKSLRANLEKGKSLHFTMGMVVALAILFTAFEWGDRYINLETNYGPGPDGIDVIDIPQTKQEDPEPPKPEIVLKTPEILDIVDNDAKADTTGIAPSEDLGGTPQPSPAPPAVDDFVEPAVGHIHINAEVMPEFHGGQAALLKWIAENVNYPAAAAENGIEGRVACSFVVNADGSISHVEVLRSKDPLLDKEAIRVLSRMPNWKPGLQQGKPVRVKFSMPVVFRLQK